MGYVKMVNGSRMKRSVSLASKLSGVGAVGGIRERTLPFLFSPPNPKLQCFARRVFFYVALSWVYLP